MKFYKLLAISVAVFLFSCNSHSQEKPAVKEEDLFEKYTIKYKHIMTSVITGGSTSSESHYVYVEGFTKGQQNNDFYFYTILLQMCYCYLDSASRIAKHPITSVSFYDSIKPIEDLKYVSADNISEIGKPFLEIWFDRKNPISLPLGISFDTNDNNRKSISMSGALENFRTRGCKDTWVGGVPKFAPLEKD